MSRSKTVEPSKQLIAWLFLLLSSIYCLALYYYQLHVGGYGLTLPHNNAIWLGALLFLTLGFWRQSQNNSWSLTPSYKQFLIVALILLSPLIWQPQQLDFALTRILGLAFGLLFILVLAQHFKTEEHLSLLLHVVLLGALSQSLLGLIQLLDIPGVAPGLQNRNGIRPTGIFFQPNLFSSFLVTGIAIGLYLLTSDRLPTLPRARRWSLGLILCTLFISSINVYLCLSRTGILALVVVLLLFLFQPKPTNRGWLVIALAAMITGFLVAGIFTALQEYQVRSGASLAVHQDRGGLWLVTWQMLKDNALFGVGYGNFMPAYAEARAQYYLDHGLVSTATPGTPHNEWLFWAVEGGIVPAITLLLFSSWWLQRLWRTNPGFACANTALLAPLLLHSMTEYPFHASAIHWISFLCLVYVLERDIGPMKTMTLNSGTFAIRSFSLVTLMVGSLFLVSNLHTLNRITQTIQNINGPWMLAPLSPLLEIKNPVIFYNQIMVISRVTELKLALATGNAEELRQFIHWGWAFTERNIHVETFEYMLNAARALGDQQELASIQARANWLFPEHPAFMAIEPQAALLVE